jgi:hypothetical protein
MCFMFILRFGFKNKCLKVCVIIVIEFQAYSIEKNIVLLFLMSGDIFLRGRDYIVWVILLNIFT